MLPDPKEITRDLSFSHSVDSGVFAADALPPDFDPSTLSFLSPPRHPAELGRLGRYRVLSILGYGGMGMVLRAEDPSLKRQVALKVMLPKLASNRTAKARFIREAQAQAAVEHDHIIPIFDVAEDHDPPFIAMPLLKGMTLAIALKANARPPLGAIVRIGREIAEGLAAAHATGLIHRDIKPANIWLEGESLRVRILDFGIARAAADIDPVATDDEPLTSAGAILGTPAYMSPEQARGEPVDSRADLFSLGVLLYKMATGHLPFHGTSTTAVLLAVVSHHPNGLADVSPPLPPALNLLITRMLSKDADQRTPSAAVAVAELGQIELGLSAELSVHAIALDAIPVGTVPNPFAEIETTEEDVATGPTVSVDRAARKPRNSTPWIAASIGGLMVVVGLSIAAYVALKPPAPQVAKEDEPKPKAPLAKPKVATSSTPSGTGTGTEPTPPTTVNTPAGKTTNMQDVYKSLTLGGGSLLGEMPHAAGDSLKIQFELKNTSTLELYPPTVMQQNGAFRLVGDYQFWIERLGNDSTIEAEGTARSFREGKRYAQGGNGISSPPSIKPEGLVMIAHALNTKGFPAGRYRFTVEYQTPERKVLQTKSVEFELK